MEVFQQIKITKDEAFRIAATALAIELHNFRTDVTRSKEELIEDAKRIKEYLENGT
jgi:predicted RNA-binding protein with PIN domain